LRKLDIGVGDFIAYVVSAKREFYNIVRIVKFWVMVHHFRFDAYLNNIGNGVAKCPELELRLDIVSFFSSSRAS